MGQLANTEIEKFKRPVIEEVMLFDMGLKLRWPGCMRYLALMIYLLKIQ